MEQWLDQLIAKGKQTGSLTYDEVNAALPPAASNLDRLVDVLEAIEREGVSVIDPEESLLVSPRPAEPDPFPLPVTDPGDSTYTEIYRRDADFGQQLRALGVPF